jgi:hypothetical protein
MPLKLKKTNLSGLRTFEGLGLNQGHPRHQCAPFKIFLYNECQLEGATKHEKFVAGIFTQIRPVWIGELENRQKTSKN